MFSPRQNHLFSGIFRRPGFSRPETLAHTRLLPAAASQRPCRPSTSLPDHCSSKPHGCCPGPWSAPARAFLGPFLHLLVLNPQSASLGPTHSASTFLVLLPSGVEIAIGETSRLRECHLGKLIQQGWCHPIKTSIVPSWQASLKGTFVCKNHKSIHRLSRPLRAELTSTRKHQLA